MSFLQKLSANARIAAAIGTMVLAAGTAAAQSAYAGTASQPSASPSKTVSLPAGNGAAIDCIAHTKAPPADHNHERLTFFYNPGGCIGTVTAVAFANIAHVCINTVELRIYTGKHLDLRRVVPVGPFCNIKVTTNWQVRHSFHNPVTVCVRSATTTGGRLGPACRTVN